MNDPLPPRPALPRIWIVAGLAALSLIAVMATGLWHLRRETLTSQARELSVLSLALADELDRGLQSVEIGMQAVRLELRVGELLPDADLTKAEPVTLLLHQPPGLSTARAAALLVQANRADDDASGIRSLPRHFKGLRDLLALPTGAAGLAVFSQDGRIIRKLIEDAALVEQEVIAQVKGQIAPDGLARLAYGLSWQGRPLPASKVSWQNEDRLRFALKGERPGQIAYLCECVGLQVEAMKRIRIGRVAYHASQPWPFPASIMLAFSASAVAAVREGSALALSSPERIMLM